MAYLVLSKNDSTELWRLGAIDPMDMAWCFIKTTYEVDAIEKRTEDRRHIGTAEVEVQGRNIIADDARQ